MIKATIEKMGSGYRIQLPSEFKGQYVTISHNGSKVFSHIGENCSIFMNADEAKNLGITRSETIFIRQREAQGFV